MSYQPFEVDSSWSWEKKKQEYKKAANAFKKNNPDATLKDFYTAYGQLRQPDGTGLQLKPKAKTTSPNYPDYQPKIKATTDVEINKRKIAEKALDEDSAKAWKKEHITDWNKKTNPTGKPITKDHPLFRRWEHRVKVSDQFWKSQEALNLPFKAGDVENLIWTNPEQWKLKDLGEQKYGSYFVFDVDDITGDITYSRRSKFHPFEFNDTTTFTGEIPFDELAEESGLAYEKYGKPKTKNIVRNSLIGTAASNVVASVLNPASAQAFGDINRDGFDKDRVERFAKGIGEDLIWGNIFSTTLKGGGKAVTPILKPVLSALPGAVNGFATTVAAPVVTGGLLLAGAKGVLDGYLTGLTGSDSNEIGRRAEEDKQRLLKENGGNGTSLRKYYRNGNGTAYEKLAKHRHLNGLEDT